MAISVGIKRIFVILLIIPLIFIFLHCTTNSKIQESKEIIVRVAADLPEYQQSSIAHITINLQNLLPYNRVVFLDVELKDFLVGKIISTIISNKQLHLPPSGRITVSEDFSIQTLQSGIHEVFAFASENFALENKVIVGAEDEKAKRLKKLKNEIAEITKELENPSYYRTPRDVVEKFLYLDSVGYGEMPDVLSLLLTDEANDAPLWCCQEGISIISGYRISDCVTEGNKSYCNVIYNNLGVYFPGGRWARLEKKTETVRFSLIFVDGKWKISDMPLSCCRELIDNLKKGLDEDLKWIMEWVKENKEELEKGPPSGEKDITKWEKKIKENIKLGEEIVRDMKTLLESK